MARQLVTASVIIEWYNMTHAELERAKRALAALKVQAAALYSREASARTRLAKALDLVIVYDHDGDDWQELQSALGDLARGTEALVPRFLSVPDSTYCRLKNAGAASSSGDIIIFLDSDVIPEPNWLSALLDALSDPQISVVVGSTYVDCTGSGVYAKAMALTWMFPLRDPSNDVLPSTWFYANNVAFRREVFVSRQFPDTDGLTHAPAKLFVERLRREGVTIWRAAGARASHPAPNGSAHFVKRAIAGGRARALGDAHPGFESVMRWIRNDVGSMSWGCKQIVVNGSSVSLRWWQAPPAMVFPVAYYTLFCLGSLLTIGMPGLMRHRFDL